MMKKVKSLLKENKFLLRPFTTLCLIYLVAFSAILLANVHYADDVARTNYGYPGWAAFGRYISTGASMFLHADRYLTNIAPLPQLIAIVLLAAASVVMICLISGREIFKEKWIKWILRVVAVLPLVLCPYFLECFSYQYDAPYMALSILFAVLPFVFRKKSWKLFVPVVVLCVLGICMSYQPSLGILMITTIFLTIKDWSEAKESGVKKPLARLFMAAIATGATALIFEKYLTIERDIYVSTNTIETSAFLPEFIKHLEEYLRLVLTDFRVIWLALMVLIAAAFVVMFVIKTRRNKIMAGIIAVIGVILMALATYAPYAALAKPLYTTRAMYAIGSLIAVLGIYVISEKGWQKILTAPVVAMAWCFFVFAFTFGNALKEQNEFRNMQARMVISDLNELLPEAGEGEKIVQTNGQIDFAPAVKHMPERNYRIVRRLLGPSYRESVPWMAYQVTQASGFDRLVYKPEVDLREKDLTVLKETEFYTIEGCDEGFVVVFKGEEFNFAN